jgi:hypothetical protein
MNIQTSQLKNKNNQFHSVCSESSLPHFFLLISYRFALKCSDKVLQGISADCDLFQGEQVCIDRKTTSILAA